MTHFDELYAKMIVDPKHGSIIHRREQFKRMYLKGMERAAEISEKNCDDYTQCCEPIREEIAEESK